MNGYCGASVLSLQGSCVAIVSVGSSLFSAVRAVRECAQPHDPSGGGVVGLAVSELCTRAGTAQHSTATTRMCACMVGLEKAWKCADTHKPVFTAQHDSVVLGANLLVP